MFQQMIANYKTVRYNDCNDERPSDRFALAIEPCTHRLKDRVIAIKQASCAAGRLSTERHGG